MKFSALALLFSRLDEESSRTAMTVMLGDALKSASPSDAQLIVYFAVGMIDPVYKAKPFNIADKNMVKILASTSGKGVKGIQEQFDRLGDLGLVAQQSLQHGVQLHIGANIVEHSLAAVASWLRQVQDVAGNGSQEKKEQLVAHFLRQCDAQSACYLVRMLLGKLRLGFSEMTLLDACSYMLSGDKSLRARLEEVYNVCLDLGLIVQQIKEKGIDGIAHISMQPGVPVRPAAAERLSTAAAIVEKLGRCVAQPKLDGFRVQVHVRKLSAGNADVHFFSRNLQDMSEMFPDLKVLVTHLPVNSCILEGEAIAYDTDTGEFLPFQETVKRKRKHGVDKAAEEFPLKLFIFDILFLDGMSELDKTQEERREVLLALFEKVPTALQDRVLPIEQRVVSTAKELEEYFYMNVTRGLEGLVVKRTDAPYTPGKRNFNWIKLKRQETGELDDTVDCVIVGYYFGQGKRAGFGIGALLVAIYDPEQDVFQTVAKIGTGLSDVEWQAMKADCDQRRAAHQPHNVQCASQLKPDVWVNPELVCVVRADEITYSPLHKAGARDGGPGLALRFPRIMGMRPDKAATEATTAQELRSLQDAQRKKRQAG